MAFLNFGSRIDSKASSPDLDPEGMAFIDKWSIEVMPRTAAKVESFCYPRERGSISPISPERLSRTCWRPRGG